MHSTQIQITDSLPTAVIKTSPNHDIETNWSTWQTWQTILIISWVIFENH